jgi:hypothetical protein
MKQLKLNSVFIYETKICNRCKLEKPLSEFHKDKSKKDGYGTLCKDCKNKANSLYSMTDKGIARLKRYRQTEKYKEANRNRSNSLSGKYNSYKRNAKRRNIEFNLTKEQFTQYWQLPCSYCGSKVKRVGLDRINNNKGYDLDNVVPCCATCNYMKLDLTQKQFKNHIIKIYNHMKLKGF